MNNNRTRTISIIIAVILGLATLLYLGGLVCQLLTEYQVWLASGTMKSRGVIRPALFQSIRRGESVVVTDPKSEIYSDTVELFRKYGYTVRVYNLLQPELSDSWSCMFDLGGDTLMAQVLTDVIIANTKGDGKGDHFWDNGEANLLKSLILYVDLDSTRRPEERNLPAVYQMLTQNTEKQLTALFDRLPLDHPARAPYSLFSQASDSVRAGVVLGLGTRLQVLRWVDATAHCQSGQRVLVRVLEVDRSDRSRLRVSASVKQAGENPYEKALKKYAVGSLYVGTVSMVDTTGVFVSLDGGIDCLCTYPKRGRPPRGCRVSVRILGINYESNRIWGVITHMSTVR